MSRPALTHGYHHASWLTFLQAKTLGGQVRKGERSTGIVFAGNTVKENEAGEEEQRRFLRFHAIFNVEQVSGLPERFTDIPPPRPLDEALLGAELAIPGQLRHPEYIDSWLRVLGKNAGDLHRIREGDRSRQLHAPGRTP